MALDQPNTSDPSQEPADWHSLVLLLWAVITAWTSPQHYNSHTGPSITERTAVYFLCICHCSVYNKYVYLRRKMKTDYLNHCVCEKNMQKVKQALFQL